MRTFFFDLDDTLIDTSIRQYKVFSDSVNAVGMQNTLSQDDFWHYKRQAKKTIELINPINDKSLLNEFSHEWETRIEQRKYLQYDQILPNTTTVLSTLKPLATLVLATLRQNRGNVLWELDQLALRNYFSAILVGSPFTNQDKTRIIKEYCDSKSFKDDFFIVGDTEADISTGKELGITTVAITCGIRSKEFLEALEPNFLINDLSELIELFRCLQKP
jgi:phosphoglycolate phosphatase